MRIRSIIFVSLAALGLAACGSKESNRGDTAARAAGREAYRVTQGAKRTAKEVGRDLQHAGQQARQGWNEARQKDRAKHPGK